jgi:ParB-like chromosome segregation protein Spo0J
MDGDTTYQTASCNSLDLRYAALRLPRPELMGGLRRSVERHGVLHPLVVNREHEMLVVLDGFKRLAVLRALRVDDAPVRVVALTPEQSKAALVTFNAPHRGLCELEEAWVVASLVREHGLRQIEVARLVGRHKSWVCRRLQLAERLEAGVVEDMRLGLVSATVARELARLPRGNQGPVAESIRLHALTSRQAAEVISRMLGAGDDAAGAELLADPMRFLSHETHRIEPSSSDPRLSPAAQSVRKCLLQLDRDAEHAERLVRSQLRAGLSESDFVVLGPRAQAVTTTMQGTISALASLAHREREQSARSCCIAEDLRDA